MSIGVPHEPGVREHRGVARALRRIPSLRSGLDTWRAGLVCRPVAEALGLEPVPVPKGSIS